MRRLQMASYGPRRATPIAHGLQEALQAEDLPQTQLRLRVEINETGGMPPEDAAPVERRSKQNRRKDATSEDAAPVARRNKLNRREVSQRRSSGCTSK